MQAELGPSVDFYLKPLIRLKMIIKYEVDDSKKRPLVFSVIVICLLRTRRP